MVMREGANAWALLSACRAFREWLDLPEAECVRRVQLALHNADAARLLMQAKALVAGRVSREYFGPDVDLSQTDYAASYMRQQQGIATADDLRYLQHSARVFGIANLIKQAYPETAQPAPEADPRVAAMLDMLPALDAAIRACDFGGATPARVAMLAQATDRFIAGAAAWTAPVPTDHPWWVGMARYVMGRAALDLGDVPSARAAFASGAQSFETAGAAAHADDMRSRITAIDTGVRADFDAVADMSLQSLRQSHGALDQATSLAALGTASLHAGDTFEYVRLLTQVAELLGGAGYPDPERDVEPAIFGWFTTAVQSVPADQLLAHLNDVGVLWARVMSARAHDPHRYGSPCDADALAAVEARPREIAAILAELSEMTAIDRAQVEAELVPWFGAPWPGAMSSEAAGSDVTLSPGDATTSVLQRAADFDTALYALRLATNAGATDPPSVRALVAESERLIVVAASLGARVHVVQAQLAHAYLMLSLARYEEATVAVSSALAALLPTAPVSDDAVSMRNLVNSYERSLYLQAQRYRARVHTALQDHASVLTTCLPVIAELELHRSRVSAPYQRAAFLAAGLELYERAAASAFRLGRNELVLQISEALKANGAWQMARSALEARVRAAIAAAEPSRATHDDGGATAAASAAFDALDAQFRASNTTLAQLPTGAGAELQERRSRLATTRAIARQRLFAAARDPEVAGTATLEARVVTPPVPMALRVTQLQQALGHDEAALSWCGVAEGSLVLCAVSTTSFETIAIIMSAGQQAALSQWVQLMTSLVEPVSFPSELEASEKHARTLATLDTLVDALAPVLLPASVRRFVAGKRQLILSPHRLLHLFPFHAIRWEPDDLVDSSLMESDPGESDPTAAVASAPDWLIGTFAVRYAPNLTSLCVPWSGCTDGRVLAVGVSDFTDDDLPSLVNAMREAREVVQVHCDSGTLVTNITRAQFMAMPLHAYRCVHLATHGSSVLSGRALDDPFASGIALADGMLDGWQLSSLELRAELVIVAACFSGQRAIGGRGLARLPGDDVLGLQSMLFESGVGTVLGALWPADDASTRVMLVEFHRGYARGLAPDVALQRAMIRFLANPFRPTTRYHWAPFFLTSLAHPRRGAAP